MSTLAEFMIVAGADNRPPMLDKSMYESWKSRMELYIQGKNHGWIILNSVENGPLIWPTVEQDNGTVRPKTYEELSDKEKLQADCDLKATDKYGYIKNHKKTVKKIGKHGHENQKSTKRSQRIKAEARKVKPAVKSSQHGQQKVNH
ncbi:hypothetical protein Tco_1544794 [Tanacetum coccineum]